MEALVVNLTAWEDRHGARWQRPQPPLNPTA